MSFFKKRYYQYKKKVSEGLLIEKKMYKKNC